MANEVKILLTVEGNTVKIQEVSQEITKLGQTAEKAGEQGERAGTQAASGLDGWAASAGSVATQLLGVLGVVASVAGAAYLAERAFTSWYSLVSGGISIVDDYQKKIIGTSYIMSTMSEVPAPDLSKAYAQWTEFHKWLYNESIYVDKQSAASSGEIFALALELEKKGVVAKTREEMETVGRLTDLMKGVIPTYASLEQQARGELEAVFSGVARIGAQTAQVLASIDPAFKKNIASARENNTELKYFESILPKIEQYTKDLMGTWDAVGASLKSAWQIINIQAFGDAHKEVVKFATELGNKLVDNGRLTATGEKAAQALSAAWESAKVSVADLMDYVFNNTDEVVGKVKTIASAVGTVASAAVKSAVAIAEMLDWLGKMYDKANKATSIEMPKEPSQRSFGQQTAANFKDAMYSAPGDLIDKTTSGISAAWDLVSRSTQGWMMVYQAALDEAARLDAIHYGELQKTSDFLCNPEFWKWAIDFENPKRELDDIKGKIQWVINLFATPYNFVINAVVTGLPSWFGAAQQKSDPNDFQGYETAGEGLRQAMKTKAPPTPPVRPYTGKEPKGGKGDGGAYAEAGRLASLFDTLTKDIARLSEGKLSEIEANYTKTIDQIYKKTEVRAVSEAELEVLAKQRSTLQKAKLQDDFDLKMAKDSGDVFLAIQKDYEKDLSSFQGLTGDKEKLEANRAKKELDARQKFQEQIMSMESSSLSAMAAAAPLLSQQLPIEKALLDIELKRADLKMEEEMRILKRNHMISAGQEDELRQLKALENQYKKYAEERKGWMLEGVSGGLKAGALDRGKEAETRTAQWTIDAMKGAETWLGDAGGQAFVDALHGKKPDLSKMFTDIGDSLTKQLFKMGTSKLFDTVWASFAGPGPAKLGTLTNPMIVSFGPGGGGIGIGKAGAGEAAYQRSVTAAGKTGMTLGGGGLGGGAKGFSFTDQYFKNLEKGETKFDKVFTKDLNDWNKKLKILTKTGDTYSDLQGEWAKDNKDAFNTEYIGQYQTDFTGMTTGITGAWGAAQGIMTAAGVSGETARLASMVTYGMQGISIIQKIAKGTILTDAYRGAAAAFAWMVELLPPPAGEIAGAAAAALAFAAISAYGLFGGNTADIASSAGGDWRVEADGMRMVHFNETIIPAGPAQGLRNLIDSGGAGSGRPGENGSNSRRPTPERFQAEIPVHITMMSPEGKVLSRRMERQVITLVRKYKTVGEL